MMNEDQLAEQAINIYKEEMRSQRAVLNRVITQRPREDGSIQYTATDQIGPIEIDAEKMRPLMKALARAIINHLKNNAVVSVGGSNYHIT